MKKLLKWLGIKCCRGCNSDIVGIYYMNEGCACDSRKIQWLCAQHVVSLEPIDRMKDLIVIHEFRI